MLLMLLLMLLLLLGVIITPTLLLLPAGRVAQGLQDIPLGQYPELHRRAR
jgi:hypothetical protein